MTSGAKKEVMWNGIVYNSIKQAAKYNKVSAAAMHARIKKGLTCDSDLQTFFGKPPKPVTWNGIDYPSIGAAARALGIATKTMWERIRRKQTCDDDIGKSGLRASIPITWNGVKYKSINAASLANNINPTTMGSYVRKGYSSDKDVETNNIHNKRLSSVKRIGYLAAISGEMAICPYNRSDYATAWWQGYHDTELELED